MTQPHGKTVAVISQAVLRTFALSPGIWETQDPFIFCAYHNDEYPGGNPATGGIADKSLLKGRHIGSDFSRRGGWSMYHGDDVPGFPQHPHYGFETITIAKKGLVDHTDSLGCGGRFGNGDVQWMTAGDGVQHSEMFPMLHPERNPLNLMQLWLNLPAASKRVPPHFAMLWSEDLVLQGKKNDAEHVMTVADPEQIANGSNLSPPPNSWAADPNNHVVILRIELPAGETHVFPSVGDVEDPQGVSRTLFVIDGAGVTLNGKHYDAKTGFYLNPEAEAVLEAGAEPTLLLFLQGRKIQEPTFHQGPFYGNTRADLSDAIQRYRTTQYGGWPWPSDSVVHDLKQKRFAKYADGTREERGDADFCAA